MTDHKYTNFLQLFGKHPELIKKNLHGLEKESLRVNQKGWLSEKKHPIALGSALFHPHYTLDFAEAQLEIVTMPHKSVEEAYQEINALHAFAFHSMGSELLWSHSAPCPIPDTEKVQLAEFGLCEEAYQKWLYRQGLALRCGKKMQLLSGVHYSFSWQEEFWQYYFQSQKESSVFRDFVSEQYLALIRNYLRMGWLCSYLFGATPFLDQSYLTPLQKPIQKWLKRSLYAPYGTSIRMSHLGYFSKIQNQLGISFNSLQEYLKDLEFALNTPHPFYQKLGRMRNGKQVQINENFLQIEAEHYTRIRPKSFVQNKGRPLDALKKGIGYVEIRNIDICPCCPVGIDLEMLRFLHVCLLYCLAKDSPPIFSDNAKIICENQNQVALFGRKPKLCLVQDHNGKEILMKTWAMNILNEMQPFAELLDDHQNLYSRSLQRQKDKVGNLSLTPSAEQIDYIKKHQMEFDEYVLTQSKISKRYFLNYPLKSAKRKQLEGLTQESLLQLHEVEKQQEDIFPGYTDMEFSTQLLMREAYLRGYEIDILDRKQNIIKIVAPKKEILVKQATQTDKDTLMSFLAMENKYVTQVLLKEKGLAHTHAQLFDDAKSAVEKYPLFLNRKIVIKPNHANYGEGIFFIEPNSKEEFKKAVMAIEKRRDQILIEPFFQGEEFRFLVIDNKVVGIVKRIPAHVVGDGIHTIRELIEIKNKRNKSNALCYKSLELSITVRANLQKQNLNPQSILKEGQTAWLRFNSNVSTGGEPLDFTEKVHPDFKKIALLATKAVNVKICGVDMLIKDAQKKPTEGEYVIIELNHNPALFIHRYSLNGKKRYVEKPLLDFLIK